MAAGNGWTMGFLVGLGQRYSRAIASLPNRPGRLPSWAGLFLGWTHIGEDQPIAFGNRVPGLAHLVPELAAIGFAGLLKATALSIELPAVIAAADAVLLDLAIIERGAAVAAAGVQQADTAMPVAEQDEVFAERANFSGDVGGVGHKTDRVPVTPEQFPHRRAAPDLGQFGPRGGRLYGIGG